MTDQLDSISVVANRGSTPTIGGWKPSRSALADSQRSFAAALGIEQTRADAVAKKHLNPVNAARDSAEQLVALTFIQPLLKQVRETNQAAPPFAPTQGEKMFGAIGDAQLAQQLVQAARFPLVDRIARDLARQAGAEDVLGAPPPLPPSSFSDFSFSHEEVHAIRPLC